MGVFLRGAYAWRVAAAVALALGAGCSMWREEAAEPSSLPAARLSPDTVVLEIFTLDAPPDFGPLCDDVWRQLDEQHIPAEVRMRLSANGVRCGRCGLQLPPAVFRLIEESMNVPPDPNSPAGTTPSALVRRRLQSRSGRRGRIVMSGPLDEVSVVASERGQPRGEYFRDATCVTAVRTYPLGDGRVRLELTPEIEHGDPKQRLVDGDGALRWQPSQERRVYDDLTMETVLAPGQTVILSAAPSLAGLGRAFFVRDTPHGPRPVFLVVRLSQTQHDDRFAPEQTAGQLVTPSG